MECLKLSEWKKFHGMIDLGNFQNWLELDGHHDLKTKRQIIRATATHRDHLHLLRSENIAKASAIGMSA